MALSLAQLLDYEPDDAKRLDKCRQGMIDIMTGLGFTATSWQSGSIPRTLGIEMPAKLSSDFQKLRAQLAAGGYVDTAVGGFLELLSLSWYNNKKITALTTQGTCVLAASALAPGPFTIAVGQLQATNGSRTFRSTTGGTLATSGSLSLTFAAEVGGISGNVPNDTILTLLTPLSGVTINNPAIGTTGTWITRLGLDEETDPNLKIRNKAKWSTLGYAGPKDAYVNWALAAGQSVTRVWVDDQNPRGAGSLDVFIAGASGAFVGGEVAAVQAYIEGTTDGVGRRPLGSNVLVRTASNRTVTLAGTIYVAAAFAGPNLAALQSAVNDAINAFFQGLPVGGTVTVTGQPGAVLFGALYSAILSVQGVVNVAFTAPLGDVVLTVGQVPVPSNTFGWATI